MGALQHGHHFVHRVLFRAQFAVLLQKRNGLLESRALGGGPQGRLLVELHFHQRDCQLSPVNTLGEALSVESPDPNVPLLVLVLRFDQLPDGLHGTRLNLVLIIVRGLVVVAEAGFVVLLLRDLGHRLALLQTPL